MMHFYTTVTINQLEQLSAWIKLHRPNVRILHAGMTKVVVDQPLFDESLIDEDGLIKSRDNLLQLPGERLLWKAPQIGAYGQYFAALMFYKNEYIYATANDEARLDSLISVVRQSAADKAIAIGDIINMEVMGDGTKHIKFKRGKTYSDTGTAAIPGSAGDDNEGK